MKHHPPPTTAIILVVAALIGACTLTDAPEQPASTSVPTSGPSPSTTGLDPTTTSQTSPVSLPETTVGLDPLPSNSEDYATSAFEAWRAGDAELLGRLMTVEARQSLEYASLVPAEQWEFDGCQATAGSTFCTWEGPDGTLTFRVDTQAASRAEEGAVVETLVAGG